MAVRKIEFTVSLDGIQPAVKQFAGVQGDHKATEIVFNIAPELYQSLTAQATNGAKLIYRFDGYDGEGGFKSSDTAELTESQLSYELEEWLTRFGGIVRAVLVISLLKDDLTQMELYSFPALLQLKNRSDGYMPDAEGYKSMSTLAQVAKDSANTAVEAKNIAVEAQNKTELARAALENGTVWVFDGGDAAGDVDLDGDGTPDMNTADIKFMVDNEMSDDSGNAIANAIVKEYIDKAIAEVKKEAALEAHPIGSYYWSSEATEPSELFGGKWERVEGRFILASSDKYKVGETGGEETHKLTSGEMPSHWHEVVVSANDVVCMATLYKTNAAAGDGWELASHGTPVTDREEYAPGDLYAGTEGDDQPHNNMPPYEVAYCWKRIA